MDNLIVDIERRDSVAEQSVEVVERKGTGHPDYICDSVMERISINLSREYLKRTGRVLHHNIDKGLLIAGTVERCFGGGRVIKPMELVIGDRATLNVGKAAIPVADIARDTARGWFMENLPHVDPRKDLKIRVVLRPGSAELADIFAKKGKLLVANDTSAAVGYAPFTPTEKAVYDTERFLNSGEFKHKFPDSGQDVKVMGVRHGHELDLTVACPLLSRFIKSEKDYFSRKRAFAKELKGFLSKYPFSAVNIGYNTLDRKGRGLDGVYLTLTGTSAEDADSGQVGRGNRVNGVVSLNRPIGTEAAAGKNPVSHVGKIYSVLAFSMAKEVYENVVGLKEVYVWLVSRIGSPVDSPRHIYVKTLPVMGIDKPAVKRKVAAIMEEFLSNMSPFIDALSRGEYPVC
jgi:S-adenosylmethionine synthetase